VKLVSYEELLFYYIKYIILYYILLYYIILYHIISIMRMWLYPCLRFPACKSHLFCATLSPLACLALPYFPTLSHKKHDVMIKKRIEHKMRILICYIILSETFLILTRIHIT